MLKKNLSLYGALLTRLPLSELTVLFERSSEYPAIRSALEKEIDLRISAGNVALSPSSLYEIEPAGALMADACRVSLAAT